MKTGISRRENAYVLFMACIVTFFCLPSEHLCAQVGDTKLEITPGLSGTNTIIREGLNGHYRVTFSEPTPGTNRFIVQGAGTGPYAFTFSLPFSSVVSIYKVREMKVVVDSCYFCGTRYYYDATKPFYTIDGGFYYDTSSVGFIARFNVVDVAAGGGQVEVVDIDSTTVVDHLEAYVGGAQALCWMTDGTRCTLQMTIGGGWYTYRLGQSTDPREHFVDIVNANGRVAVLSRFLRGNDTLVGNLFALRYGNIDFIGSSTGYRLYDVLALGGAYRVGKDEEMKLVFHRQNKELTVAWLTCSAFAGSAAGHWVLCHVPGEGQPIVEMQSNDNLVSGSADTYTRIKEVVFNRPVSNPNTSMAMLLESTVGSYTAMRYPLYKNPSAPGNYIDTVRMTENYVVESILPEEESISIGMQATGYQNFGLGRQVWLSEEGLHYTLYHPSVCWGAVLGKINIFPCNIQPVFIPETMQLRAVKSGSCAQKMFTSSRITMETQCENGTWSE